MMIFIITMFILLMSLVTLIRGNIFYETAKEISQFEIDKIDGKVGKDEISPGIAVGFFAIFYVILQLCFVYSANDIDILHWPTMTVLGIYIANFAIAIATKNNAGNTQEEKRAHYVLAIANAKRRSFKGTMTSLIWVVYAGYILWLVMGGKL